MKMKMIKILVVFMAVSLIFSATIGVFAAGNVTYDGSAKKFIFAPGGSKSPTDLFEKLKGVMPGDCLTQEITVKNEASNEVKVNIYMRSLGAKEESKELLSKLQMTVSKSEENEMAYMFDATAEKTDGLTDWVLLGTLYSGGEVNIEVTLDVPIELGNEFQDAVGYIDWQFRVEEMPIEPDDPKPPQTGDTTRILPYLAAVCVCAAVFYVMIIYRRKRRENEA